MQCTIQFHTQFNKKKKAGLFTFEKKQCFENNSRCPYKTLQMHRKGSNNCETMFWTVKCLPGKEERKRNLSKENGICKTKYSRITAFLAIVKKFQCYSSTLLWSVGFSQTHKSSDPGIMTAGVTAGKLFL